MTTSFIEILLNAPIRTADRFWFESGEGQVGSDSHFVQGLNGQLRMGDSLEGEGFKLSTLRCEWAPGRDGSPAVRRYLVESDADVSAGRFDLKLTCSGRSLAWVTLSDKGAAGKRVDESGPLIEKLVRERMELSVAHGFVIPDDGGLLKGMLADLALVQGVDLILTTGGTGVGLRDVTPEATLAIIEKRLPGFERAMTAASLAKTPHGAISRAVAGTLGGSLIVNLPGSPKAVRECLEPLLPTLSHTIEKLQGDPSDCAALHADRIC